MGNRRKLAQRPFQLSPDWAPASAGEEEVER